MKRPPSAIDAADRLETALHEAAHFVAAISCNSSVTSVRLGSARERRYGIAGQVKSFDLLICHEAFVGLAGYAWDERHYPPDSLWRSEPDLQRAKDVCAQLGGREASLGEELEKAREFVVSHEPVIREAAELIMGSMPLTGVLRGRNLSKLVESLRLKIAPYPGAHPVRPKARPTPVKKVAKQSCASGDPWSLDDLLGPGNARDVSVAAKSNFTPQSPDTIFILGFFQYTVHNGVRKFLD